MIRRRQVVLRPTGGAGTSTASTLISAGRPGILRAVAVSYTAQAATTDVSVKRDGASGTVMFARDNSATNLLATPVRQAALLPTGASPTAGSEAYDGVPFGSGIHVSVVQADASTGNKDIVVDLWIEV